MIIDFMIYREDIEKILFSALSENSMELNSNQFQKLLVLFLETDCEIDQTKQPITSQIERFAREFLLSDAAREVWNDANPN